MTTSVRSIWRATALLTCIVVTGLLAGACSEKDVPYVVDEDELVRYVKETSDARELFSTGLIGTDPYSFPGDDGVHVDSVIDHERTYEVLVSPADEDKWLNYGALGELREGLVHVTDEFTVQTTSTYPSFVRVDTATRKIGRVGFFLKLGDDAEEYVGWLLWGFTGIYGPAPFRTMGIDAAAHVERFDGSRFSVDLSLYLRRALFTFQHEYGQVSYVRLDEIDTILVGSRLVPRIVRSSSSATPPYLLSGIDTGGQFMRPMLIEDTVSFDTIRTARSSLPQYNLLFVQEFDDNHDFVRAWCIPYRK